MQPNNFTLGWHLVAFLDVLGQREKFRELKLPKTPEEHKKVEVVLGDTAGFVLYLRERFTKQFDSFEAGFKNFPEGGFKPEFIGFSDSFVTSVPLRNNDGHCTPIVKIFSALYASSIVMLTSLTGRHALRGGIDVGLATELGPHEIYGTALERAYLLECRDAESPRILIGDELWKYLSDGVAACRNMEKPLVAMENLIQQVMDLTTVDADGKRLLDYLGPLVRKFCKQNEAKILVEPAYQFVLDQHLESRSKGNAKLIERYAATRKYFEDRLPDWKIPISTM